MDSSELRGGDMGLERKGREIRKEIFKIGSGGRGEDTGIHDKSRNAER